MLGSLVAALVATGLAGWRRSEPLRHGRSWPGPFDAGARARSSRTTWLAACAGAAIVGMAVAADVTGAGRVCGVAAGGFVLVTGLAARVTGLSSLPDGLVVRRAALGDRVARRESVRRVIPPRWPLGAWRILGEGRAISLMPSDLLGAEAALAALVRSAGLRFDGRAWRRPGEER